MFWLNLLHIYQPPEQKKEIIEKITKQSYSQIFDILKKHLTEKITLNINGSLTEQFDKYGLQNIIDDIKKLAERGQIELTGSAKYHLILPLIPEQEIIRQIELNDETNKKYFGKIYQPKGFFIPELAYSKRVAKILKKLGYQWIILDEMAIPQKNIQSDFYQIDGLKDFYVFFRNRKMSDVFFTGRIKSANDFFEMLKTKNNVLVTALDGENLGHHQLKMAEIWQEILDCKKLQTMTISEYLDCMANKNIKIIEPLECNWASKEVDLKNGIPFAYWNNPNNAIHQLQWELSRLAIKVVYQIKQKYSATLKYQNIRKELDQALFSCQYWWATRDPNWSPWMIKKGAEKLLKVIQMASDAQFIDLFFLQNAKKIYDKIIFIVKEWDKK